MDFKKSKKSFKDEIYPNNNREVLVLSPELLQKLGINLGNIQSDPGGAINSSNSEFSYELKVPNNTSNECPGSSFEEPRENRDCRDTSILKTANLMKESVLLSPTFSALKPNEILNEDEINDLNSNIFIEDKQIPTKNPKLYENQSDAQNKNIEKNDDNILAADETNIVESRNEIQGINVFSENPVLLRTKPLVYKNRKASLETKNKVNILSEEVIDAKKINELKRFPLSKNNVLIPVTKEIIISKKKSITNTKIISHKSESQNKQTDQEMKIYTNGDKHDTVMVKTLSQSEDIRSESKQTDLRCSVSEMEEHKIINENDISIGEFVNMSHLRSNQDLKSIEIEETTLLTSNDLKNGSSLRNCSVSKPTTFHNKSSPKDMQNAPVNGNLNDNTSQSVNIDSNETIKNISYSASNGSTIDIQSARYINNGKSMDYGDDCKETEINSKENIVTSKLCIQGVEKPGGEQNLARSNIKCAKTYLNKKKTKSFNTEFNNINFQNLDTFDIDYKINNDKQYDSNYQKFCICYDFGNLNYYETVESYQHIHFYSNKNDHGSLDILFSIYDDEDNFDLSKNETNTEYINESCEDDCGGESFDTNICLHHIRNTYENSDVSNDVFTDESTDEQNVTNNDETSILSLENKINVQIKTHKTNDSIEKPLHENKNKLDSKKSTPKKRKRRLSSSSESDNDNLPLAKRVTEKFVCGVCSHKIARTEWEQHITKKHCCIAWKEGETIDFSDEQLLQKLTKRLCDTGMLVCTFCKYEHNELNKFLSHAKKCATKIRSNNIIKETIRTFQADQSTSQGTGQLVCGVCHSEVNENLWIEHICKEHNYLAWDQNSPPLDCTDQEAVLNFLDITRKMIGTLECSNCGIKRKYVKAYINHIRQCANIELLPEKPVKELETKVVEKKQKTESETKQIKCGVCHIELNDKQWIDHIRDEHKYLAWKEGEEELNVNDSKEVHDHLHSLTKETDGLICSKCGLRRKYVKSYLSHIKKCKGPSSQNTSFNDTVNESISEFDDTSVLNDTALDESQDDNVTVKCGVCHKELREKLWIKHLQQEHAYMAWKEGDPALNLDSQTDILQYLNDINKKYNGLICNKCGITRKYVKVFLSHVENCDSTFAVDDTLKQEQLKDKEPYECAVCSEVVDNRDWKSHAMKKHYNVAWAVGHHPIDVRSPNAVDICLKQYKKQYKKLECRLCGLTRVSTLGFYAHIIQCGKSEEEIDVFRDYCDICNSKYLCIYKTQHYQMHREQELAKERKLSFETKMKLELSQDNETELGTEGRQAAKRARKFIGKYQTFEYNCSSCGFGVDEENVFEDHVCNIKKRDCSDSELSLNLDRTSDEETEDSDIDSNISDMDIPRDRWRKHGDSRSLAMRIKRIPFEIKNPKLYITESAEEFRKENYTDDIVYPQWRNCKYNVVPDDEVHKYMPPLDNSCKLMIGNDSWKTLNRFEGMIQNGVCTAFVGSSIQCVSWSPARGADEDERAPHVLAASCHNAADCPRRGVADTRAAHNMLQIWDFGDMHTSIPKFVLGIAHDYGTVWSIDWCASGARDPLPDNSETFQRLGLLAMACSNGSAYILCVPYPSTIVDKDKIIYNLTPVAELRLSRGEREKFQATSISWSPQRGHSIIMVGYSDGTTALYDLESESPLLVDKEDGISIFYPYHDDRPHNTCITGVSTLAGRGAEGVCATSSASPSGAESARRGAAALRLRTLLPCSAVVHSPHWPAALLAENDGIVTQPINELDWWGCGQRLGSVQSCGACAQCGALAAYAPPVLRLMTPHPAFPSLNKQPIAFINMAPLAKKRKKQKTDELAVILEPRTYDDAVKIYGVELKFIKDLDKSRLQQLNNKPKEHCHERFPLSDIPSMSFNTSPTHHRKLALATHAGFIFVINV